MVFNTDMDNGEADREPRGPAVTEQAALYRAYFAYAPLAVMVVDSSGRYTEVNPAACRFTGYEESELLGMSLTDLLAEESLDAGRQHFARVQEGGHASGEFCWVRKDGSKRWSTGDAVKLSEDRFIGFFLDVTDRRQAEDSLASAHRLLEAVLHAVPDLLIVMDRDWRIRYTNARGHESIVQTDGEKRSTCYGRFKLLDHPCEDCSAIAVFETGCTVEREMLNPADQRFREMCAFPIFDASRRVEAVVEHVRDVTDRKRTESILMAERDLALRLHSLQDPMDIIRACLDAALALSGLECGGVYLADSASGRPQLVHHTGLSPEFVESIASHVPDSVQDQVFRKGEPVVVTRNEMEQLGLLSALREGLFSALVIPVLTEGVAVACLNLASRTAEPISPHVIVGLESVAAQMGESLARTRAEELCRQSETRYRLLVETAPCSILVVQDGRYVYANPYAERLLGYSSDDLTQVPVFETIHPESRDVILHRMKTVEHGKSNPPRQVKILRKDGVAVQTETASVPIMFGGRTAALVVGQDITARRQAEERVRLLAELLDASPTSTTVHDAQGNFLYANEKTFSLHGFSREEFVRLNLHQLDLPDSERLVESRLREIAEKGEASFEVDHYRKDGTAIPLHVDTKLARWGDQEVFLSVATDVSDLKRTEQALREREARLRGILDAASESVFLIDREGIVLECNETTARRLGKTIDELLGKPIYRFLPPDLAQSRRVEVQKALQSRKPVQFEDRRAGVWFEHTVYPVFDDAGAVVECAVFGRDITERRRAEESLSESEERLRLATKATNDVIWDWDIVHDSQRWNEAGTVVFGWSDIVERPQTAQWWLQRVHPDDRSRVDEGFLAVFASHDRCHWQDEYRFLKADGSYAFVLDRGYVMRDEQGRAVRMIGAMLDLTGRKQAEESLRQSEAHYRVLAETMLQGVVHQDKDGTIISMNPAAELILGKSRDQFLGSSSVEEETFTIREDGSPFPGLEHPAIVALRTGQPLRGAVMGVFNPKVNAHRWINVDAVPLFRPGEDHPYQVYTVFEDITERRHMEQQKLEMERRLLHAQKLESLGILAGGIAHDFNNILAGIMGYADLLKARLPSSEPAREDVDIIKKAVQRAADLTQQMLAYSGKGKFAIVALDLSRIIADMRKMLDVSVSKKATLTYNLASCLPTIEADSAQVHQVILNLVINASEALGENSGVIAITTHAIHMSEIEWAAVRTGSEASAGRYVCLEVADTGCGMSRETLEKILDPFFTTKFTGRGLGLAALHGIVRGHKGGLRVTSEPGKGTTFQVYFPASTVAVPTSGAEAGTSSWRGSGTVLVVDDEEIVRNTAKRMIEHAGFSVLTANDGEVAIHLYRQHQSEITCVLLDLTMPKMNGEETMRALRTINPNICVILSSGFSEDNATERFSDLGLGGFIQKPYQLDTMTNTLRKALASSKKGRSASGDADTLGVSSSPSRSTPLALAWSESAERLPRQEGGTVLLVDDDTMSRTSTQILFEQAGFSVLTASDGEEAVKVFRAHRDRIVCVFLDLNLPRMNGEEALRAIRQIDRQVHAIVTSGCDADTMKRRFAGLEVLEFVPKPAPLDTAMERLQEAVKRASIPFDCSRRP